MNSAFVLNMSNTGLGVVRSLGRLKIPVTGVDHRKDAEGFSSRFCSAKVFINDPATEPESCLDQLMSLSEKYNEKPVLLPTSDLYVSFISAYREQLTKRFLFNIPSRDLLASIVDKRKQYDLASAHHIPIARSFYPGNPEELHPEYKNLRFPLFIKGVSSTSWTRTFSNKGFVVSDTRELDEILNIVFKNGLLPVIQEIIKGPNKNHFKVCAYYARNGELKCLFSTQKARQFPVDFGVGCYMKSDRMEELMDLARGFYEGIGYTGVGSIEFKLDDRDKIYKYIELNPRFWEQNIQATYAGINFAYANYLDCVGQKVPYQADFKENVVWINSFADTKSFIYHKYRKTKQLSFFSWLSSLFNVNCHAYFAKDDVMPAFKHLRDLIKHYFYLLKHRSTN